MPSRAEAKRWRSLQRRKGRDRHGLFLAEGPHLVDEVLASPLVVRHVLHTRDALDDPEMSALVERCRDREIPVDEVGEDELAEFADTVTPQGTLAVAEIPERGWRELEGRDVLVLDAVQDPGNVGTILRTAEALGVGGVISLKGSVDHWNPKVVRASAGSAFRVPVLDSAWQEALEWLESEELPVWAADPAGEALGRGEAAPPRVALVLGNEGSGVRPEILRRAARRLAVSLRGPVESLNVAVAAALLMDRIFSARRR